MSVVLTALSLIHTRCSDSVIVNQAHKCVCDMDTMMAVAYIWGTACQLNISMCVSFVTGSVCDSWGGGGSGKSQQVALIIETRDMRDKL